MPSIATYLRVRPTKKPTEDLEVTEDEPDVFKVKVAADALTKGQGQGGGQIEYRFKFAKIFPQETTQDDVFETVGRKVCDRFLEGYNCTIFAYGQTGSGKTFTIEGSSKSFNDRGLLPRCLAYIYQHLRDQSAEEPQVEVTYLEIYNDTAYDLLNSASGANARLPKVAVSDRGTSVRVHNLSVHAAPTEDVAQNLVFMGRANRTVAATTMNLTSSRSHSLFTIAIAFKRPNSDTLIKAKLNLVDLAGSERVAKSHAAGQQLKEAKHINLSLHYLEAVIIALQHKHAKRHVPYRNSLLTKLLRDSLGGNCLTAMIATVSATPTNRAETISTCRFAQRVALVDNNARRNEVLDDKTIIKRLRRRVAELQAELTIAQEVAREAKKSGGDEEEEDDGQPVDRSRCAQLMKQYVNGKLRDPLAAVPQARALRYCFEVLRSIVLQQRQDLEQLQQDVEDGMKSKEQLRNLKQKFGVARARMRNMESSLVKPSGYGRSPRKSKSKQHQQRAQVPGSTSSSGGRGGGGGSTRSSQTRRRQDGQQGSRSSQRGGGGASKRSKVKTHIHDTQQPRRRKKKPKKGVNRSRAQKTLILIGRKEQELMYALEDMTDKLEQQRQVVSYCDRYAPHRLLAEKMREKELEEDQAQVAAQLIEIQNGRLELEDALGLTFDDLAAAEEPPTRAKSSVTQSTSSLHASTSMQRSRTFSGVGVDASQQQQQQPNVQVTEEDARLHELRSKEEATRRRLASLKQELMRESTNTTSMASSISTAAISKSASSSSVPLASTRRVEGNTRARPAMREDPRQQHQQHQHQRQDRHHHQQQSTHPQQLQREMTIAPSVDRNHPLIRSAPNSATQSTKERRSDRGGGNGTGTGGSGNSSAYMTSLQKQRDRVQRIRRAIVAAEVIQRAWRRYRARKHARR
ncbi:hypothetical protein PTSG_08714 [Salpingoeca rosetta]|uniref:Kinesin-like protein n=1 Tax=Salpingoeca rosetta (strain ATCC 50818 / BSB-021) TaxID=946362 RepID=F2UKH0_SALR5|nr:uncharacterized protein PTSG_08714 [Salpingoeca rosetta]EGD77619.1 hypothetical protein PTSG_08714 [Salpingoeca rosetta]|eukprot:XP_004990507.1 hypothetical protein PTSG_08714 [Salpingoeca rosetta]